MFVANEVEVVKRPKLEAHPSTASSGTGSSSASHQGDPPSARGRLGSAASISRQWHPSDNHTPSQVSIMPKLTVAPGGTKVPSSPKSNSPTVLPGYRDSIFQGPQQIQWREGQRDENFQQNPHPASINDGRIADLPGSQQHARRASQTHPPPLLTTESTNRSTGSTASTVSSAYFTPRTPMEPPFERSLPIPSMYAQKGNYENQLPPLRPTSLSPQATMGGSQQSPNSR